MSFIRTSKLRFDYTSVIQKEKELCSSKNNKNRKPDFVLLAPLEVELIRQHTLLMMAASYTNSTNEITNFVTSGL
jgi:hypothetical protein